MKRAILMGLVAGCVAMTGCGPKFYKAKGEVKSSGGTLGDWARSPVGCRREDADGDSSKLMMFSFQPHSATGPDRSVNEQLASGLPLQMEIAKSGSGLAATMTTIGSMDGYRLDSGTCKTFDVRYKGHAAQFAGQPSFSGTLKMDCMVQGSHLTADVTFDQCE